MVQELARQLQIKRHHSVKDKHKRMLMRTFSCRKGSCDYKVIDDRKITLDMVYN